MDDRRAFLVQAKTDAVRLAQDSELLEEILCPAVILAAFVDFDNEIDGWGPSIKRSAKRRYLASLKDCFSNETLQLYGLDTDDISVFDRYCELYEVDCLTISPTDWLGS